MGVTELFACVPLAVLSDPELTDADVRVYGAIKSFFGCAEIRPGMDEIGRRSACSKRAARRCVGRLKQRGYIRVENGGGAIANRYEFVPQTGGTEVVGGTEVALTQARNGSGPRSILSSEEKILTTNERRTNVPAEAIDLAQLLRGCILRNNPGAKLPSESGLRAWEEEADRMLRLDKREAAEARELLLWAQSDFASNGSWGGWATVILSMRKFREKFDDLTMHRRKGANGSGKDREHDRRNGIPKNAGADASQFAGTSELRRRQKEARG